MSWTRTEWLYAEVSRLNNSLSLLYENDKTSLRYNDFVKIDKAINELLITIKETKNKKYALIVYQKDIFSDITPNNDSSIFSNFTNKTSFEEYFHTNLNPDLSPAGFLEELSYLLNISEERPVVIFCPDKPLEEQCLVLKNYIESQ